MPGRVRLAYDKDGSMKVYPYNSAKQNDDTVPDLYEIVYFHDPFSS